MEFFTTTSAASRRAGGCVVVGVYEKGKPGLGAAEIDTASKGLIKRHIKDGDISGRIGTSLLLPAVPGVRSARVLVVGLGKSAEFGVTQFRRANETAIRLIKGSKVRDIVNYLTLEDVDGASPYYLARYAVETTGNCFYTFNEMKSGRKRRTPLIRKMGIAVKKRGDAAKTLLFLPGESCNEDRSPAAQHYDESPGRSRDQTTGNAFIPFGHRWHDRTGQTDRDEIPGCCKK
jgi:leucyl aminopeptidase